MSDPLPGAQAHIAAALQLCAGVDDLGAALLLRRLAGDGGQFSA